MQETTEAEVSIFSLDADKQEASPRTGPAVDSLSALLLGALQVDTLGAELLQCAALTDEELQTELL